VSTAWWLHGAPESWSAARARASAAVAVTTATAAAALACSAAAATAAAATGTSSASPTTSAEHHALKLRSERIIEDWSILQSQIRLQRSVSH